MQVHPSSTPLLSYDEDAVNEVWEKHLKWKQLADQKSFLVVNGRKAFIAFLIIGAALQTLATQLSGSISTIIGYLGAALLAAVPMLKGKFLAKEYKSERLTCTALSAEIESEVYQFRARIEEYGGPNPGHDLRHKVAKIIKEYSNADLDKVFRRVVLKNDGELVPLIPDGKPIEEWYIENRFDPAVKSFEDEINFLSKRSLFLDRLEHFFSILAAAISFLASSNKLPNYIDNRIGIWVPVATTAAAQVSKFTASSTVDDWIEVYTRDKELLTDKKYHYFDGENRDFAQFVSDCEGTVDEGIKKWRKIQTRTQ